MVVLTEDQVRALMEKPENIRIVSVLAYTCDEKSSLADFLIANAGIVIEKPVRCYTRIYREDSASNFTIKPSGPLYYEREGRCGAEQSIDHRYLINLVDLPMHVIDVPAMLSVVDGALVLVDGAEGVSFQTESALRRVLLERIKPILIVNKVDYFILELGLDGEAVYQNYFRIIEKVNAIFSAYDTGSIGDLEIDPSKANIAFASDLKDWAFTLQHFASIYTSKFGVPESKMMARLWGENYFDQKSMKWQTSNASDSGEILSRGFCSLVLDPIKSIVAACMESNNKDLDKMLHSLGILLRTEDRELQGRELLSKIMEKWLNASDCLLEMMVLHLPSPKSAGAYRTDILYEGPRNDSCSIAMHNCDPSGPVMIYIFRMIPNYMANQFIAVGRVFCGTVVSGQRVRIVDASYQPGCGKDPVFGSIRQTVLIIGKSFVSDAQVPAGNIVGLMGVDQFIVKTGSITSQEQVHSIRTIKHSVSPVVRVAIKPKNIANLPKLVEGLRKLAKTERSVKCSSSENGDYIMTGTEEFEIEVCLNNLETEFACIELIKSDPMVIYKETITVQSEQVCVSKSPNKHNRLYCIAIPLEEGLTADIEGGKVTPQLSKQDMINVLGDIYNWDKTDVAKLWDFGPESLGPNLLVDTTSGVQNINEIRDSMQAGFQWFTQEGVLCGESMRGVRINVVDVTLHSDAIHRGAGQIIPSSRKVYYACELTAKPALQEPVFLVEIRVLSNYLSGVYQCLNTRRSALISEESVAGTPLILVKAHMPVAESFGFVRSLRLMTSNQAFSQSQMTHWQIVTGDPLDPATKASEIIRAIRKTKGMIEDIPSLEDYSDKL